MKHLICTALSAFSVLFLLSATAHAITHTSSYRVPLQPSNPDCGGETNTTSVCTGTGADFPSVFTFNRGTLEIQSTGRVGLKLDEIQLRNGETCPVSNCSCFNTNTGCTLWNDCSGGDPCVLDEGGKVVVEIWAQGFWNSNGILQSPCNTQDCVRRVGFGSGGANDCHKTFEFLVSGDRGGINALTPTSNKFFCGEGNSGVVRRIEVQVKDNGSTRKLAARPAWDHSVDLTWSD